MKSTLTNMIIVLVVITAVASAAVGGMYILTKEPIAKAKIAKINSGIEEVIPEFDNNPYAESMQAEADGSSVMIYPAKLGDEVVGYAVECFSNNGFGGKIGLLVGFTTEGKITKISVLEHHETPGLGDKIDPAKSKFSVQFEGADPANMNLTVKKDGGDVDAITASTISSRAYTEALRQAYTTFKNIQ